MSKFTKVIANTLKIDEGEVTPDLALGHTESWDSLTHFNLIAALEEAFQIRFETEEIPQLKTIEALEKAVHAKTT